MKMKIELTAFDEDERSMHHFWPSWVVRMVVDWIGIGYLKSNKRRVCEAFGVMFSSTRMVDDTFRACLHYQELKTMTAASCKLFQRRSISIMVFQIVNQSGGVLLVDSTH